MPHAAEALDTALDRHGMRSAFVTNNAARTPTVIAAHLVELGVRAQAADVVTSAQAGARMLAERLPQGSHVLVIGGPGVPEALRERGLLPVESVDDGAVAVLQGYGPDVGWRQLAEGSLAIQRGMLWVATNLDRTIPSPRGRVLGNGSMVAALRHATGAEPLVAGKPEPPLMLESVERSRAVRPIVVGDRLGHRHRGRQSLRDPLAARAHRGHGLAGPCRTGAANRPTYLGHDLRALLVPAPVVDVEWGVGVVEGRCGGVLVRVRVATDAAPGGQSDAAETPAGGAGPRADGWWLPEGLKAAGRGGASADGLDLDVVRALVAVAWALSDAGASPAGPAQVHAATR